MKYTPRLNKQGAELQTVKCMNFSKFRSMITKLIEQKMFDPFQTFKPTSLRQTNRNPPVQLTREAIKIPRYFYR